MNLQKRGIPIIISSIQEKTKFTGGNVMKRALALALVCVTAVSLAGCSQSGGGAEQAEAEAGKKVRIMIGYENNPGEPIDMACQEWKRLVEEKSGGTMRVDLYPSSQLGSKDNIIDQAVNGDCVVTLANGPFSRTGVYRTSVSCSRRICLRAGRMWKSSGQPVV